MDDYEYINRENAKADNWMRLRTKDQTFTIIPADQTDVTEISVFGVYNKINEPVFDIEVFGKHYDMAIPVILQDADEVRRPAAICFPKIKLTPSPVPLFSADECSDGKALYTIYFDSEEVDKD